MISVSAIRQQKYLLMSILLIATLLFWLWLRAAFDPEGGSEVGNGGQVIKCIVDSEEQYRLYDVVEAQIYEPNWSMELQLQKTRSVDASMEVFLAALDKIDGQRSDKYRAWWAQFWEETKSLSSQEALRLKTTTDSFGGLEPNSKNCEIINVAFQHTHPFYRRYLIVEDIYKKLSQQDQFMLILHELIYRDVIESGISRDSRNVRYLTTFFTSQKFFQWVSQADDQKVQKEYHQLLEKWNLRKPWMNGDQLLFVRFLYRTILNREAETDYVVENWSKHCTQSGARQLIIEFLNSIERVNKEISLSDWKIMIKEATGVDKIPSHLVFQWQQRFAHNKKKANIVLIKQLLRGNMSCFDFIKTHQPFLEYKKLQNKP